MLSTSFTDVVGCTVPVQLAAMGGGVTTPELVAAVSRAGGLGMLQAGGTRPLADRLDEIVGLGSGPFGVNCVPPLGQTDDLDTIRLAASRAQLVEHHLRHGAVRRSGVGEVREVATAGDVLARLAESAEALLRAW